MRWFSAVPRGLSRPSGFPPSGKIKHFRSLAVLRGHNGLMCLAAKRALVCLLLEHVVAASFVIQLLAASKDDKPPKLLLLYRPRNWLELKASTIDRYHLATIFFMFQSLYRKEPVEYLLRVILLRFKFGSM